MYVVVVILYLIMIIRYFEWGIFNKDKTFPIWEEIIDKDGIPKGRELTRQEACEIIEECGLKLVYSSNSGQIFDVPSEEFKQAFEGDTADNYL